MLRWYSNQQRSTARFYFPNVALILMFCLLLRLASEELDACHIPDWNLPAWCIQAFDEAHNMRSAKNMHHTVRQRVSSEKQTVNACQTQAFSVFSDKIIPVIAQNWEHLVVPVISQSSNQSCFLSEEVSLVLVSKYRDVRALFISIILPVRLKHAWWECVIHVSLPPSEPHGFTPNSIGQQKWTGKHLSCLKHQPRWLPFVPPVGSSALIRENPSGKLSAVRFSSRLCAQGGRRAPGMNGGVFTHPA